MAKDKPLPYQLERKEIEFLSWQMKVTSELFYKVA